MQPRPPFVFDWDGDLRVYESLQGLVAAFEAQDLEELANNVAYDSCGMAFILGLDQPKNQGFVKCWDYRYPVKAYETGQHCPEESREVLLGFLRQIYTGANGVAPDLEKLSIGELIAMVKANG